MQLHALAHTSCEVAQQRSRLKKISQLAECLRTALPDEQAIAVSFLCGKLNQGKVGLGYAAVRKAIDEADQTRDRCELSLIEADLVFAEIAMTKGAGSTAKRHAMLVGLLNRTSASGQEFLAKLIVGELRTGALEGIMIEALASATALPAAEVRRAAMLSGDLAHVSSVAQSDGLDGIRRIQLELFRPVQPMLAEPAEAMQAAMEKLEAAYLEYKLDGVRVQVHKDGERVQVYTRQLNDVTANVPELVELAAALAPRQLVLDGEILALRPNGRPYPFQTTMQRFGRRRNIQSMRESLPLSVSFFDCLRVESQSLIDASTRERYVAMCDSLPADTIIPRIETNRLDQAEAFLSAAIQAGHEGVMAKSLEAEYTAGCRGQSWLKVKPSHTLDLVILAAEWGSGRRQGWLSNLHLGARDARSGQFVMLGKTFKGLTDKMLAWQTEHLLALESSRDQYTVHVRPELVVEIAFNEVQQSPHYASGYALRFARVKQYRVDKSADEADTLETVQQIFAAHRQ